MGSERPWLGPAACFSPVAVSSPVLAFLPSALAVWFSCSVQHQGRLSLDLSHRVGSDYSDMRTSHGSNSLPSSARLGNGATGTFSPERGTSLISLSTCILWPDLQVAWPYQPFSAPGAEVGPTLHWEPRPSAFRVSGSFPGSHAAVPGNRWGHEPRSLSLSLLEILGFIVLFACGRPASSS